MDERFEVVMEPSNLWMVWDREEEEPAIFFNRILGGMSPTEAKAACDLLNHYDRKQKREAAA
ncbi:MAG TPA: hypothetical protein VNS02_02670 [Rhizobiaceae bacterium]|nr:hypothetical protein [Rhizobiaceae bacterium]